MQNIGRSIPVPKWDNFFCIVEQFFCILGIDAFWIVGMYQILIYFVVLSELGMGIIANATDGPGT